MTEDTNDQENKAFPTTSLFKILNMEYGEQEWLVKNLIPSPSISILTGDPGSFKSAICLHLALCAIKGGVFLNQFTTTPIPSNGGVLILDKENHFRDIKRRALGLKADESAPLRFHTKLNFSLDNMKDLAALIKYVKTYNIGLIIIDPLSWYHFAEENTSKEMGLVMRNIKQIAVETSANIVLVHHHRKEQADVSTTSNSIRGSTGILSAVDCHIALSLKESEGILVFKQTKLRQGKKVPEFSVKIVFDPNTEDVCDFAYVGSYDKHSEKYRKLDTEILNLFTENIELSLIDILSLLSDEYKERVVRNRLKTLVYEKKLAYRSVGSNKHIYSRLSAREGTETL